MRIERELRPVPLKAIDAAPLITVMIPVHNYEQFVGDAIRSVRSQTYENFELILCDDGSTDNSLAVATEHALADFRVRVIQKANGGQASALNAMFVEARGDIICILDADDQFHPEKLARLVDYFQEHSDIGVVVHPMILMDQNGRPADTIPFLSKFEQGWIGDKVIRRGGRWRYMPSSALSFRQELGEYCFPISEERFRVNAEAYVFTILPLVTCVGYIRDPLSCYRMHDSNMSGEFSFNAATLHYREECMTVPNSAVNERLQAMGYRERLDLARNLDYAMIRFKLHMLEDQPLATRLQRFRDLLRLVLRDDLMGFGGKMLVLLGHVASLFLHLPGRQWIFNRMISPSPAKRFLQAFRHNSGLRQHNTPGGQRV